MKSCNKATMGSTGGGINSRVPHSQLPYPKNLISDIIGKYCDMELSAEQVDKLETVGSHSANRMRSGTVTNTALLRVRLERKSV